MKRRRFPCTHLNIIFHVHIIHRKYLSVILTLQSQNATHGNFTDRQLCSIYSLVMVTRPICHPWESIHNIQHKFLNNRRRALAPVPSPWPCPQCLQRSFIKGKPPPHPMPEASDTASKWHFFGSFRIRTSIFLCEISKVNTRASGQETPGSYRNCVNPSTVTLKEVWVLIILSRQVRLEAHGGLLIQPLLNHPLQFRKSSPPQNKQNYSGC